MSLQEVSNQRCDYVRATAPLFRDKAGDESSKPQPYFHKPLACWGIFDTAVDREQNFCLVCASDTADSEDEHHLNLTALHVA